MARARRADFPGLLASLDVVESTLLDDQRVFGTAPHAAPLASVSLRLPNVGVPLIANHSAAALVANHSAAGLVANHSAAALVANNSASEAVAAKRVPVIVVGARAL